MALLRGQCHCILVCGNLKNSNTISIQVPHEDIKTNLWQFSFNDLSVSFNEKGNFICGLSSNYVTDIKYNDSKQIVSYCPILCQTLFNGRQNELKLIRFEKSWFYISNPDVELKIVFQKLINGKVSNVMLNIDCDIYVTILLQRVQ